MIWENLLADAGYNSGENYSYMATKGLTSYITPRGTYKGGPEGFEYIKQGNYWLCPLGRKVTFRNRNMENGNLKETYFTTRAACKDCPIKTACMGKSHEKQINTTAFGQEYEKTANESIAGVAAI